MTASSHVRVAVAAAGFTVAGVSLVIAGLAEARVRRQEQADRRELFVTLARAMGAAGRGEQTGSTRGEASVLNSPGLGYAAIRSLQVRQPLSQLAIATGVLGLVLATITAFTVVLIGHQPPGATGTTAGQTGGPDCTAYLAELSDLQQRYSLQELSHALAQFKGSEVRNTCGNPLGIIQGMSNNKP